jgi:hypothetical protein
MRLSIPSKLSTGSASFAHSWATDVAVDPESEPTASSDDTPTIVPRFHRRRGAGLETLASQDRAAIVDAYTNHDARPRALAVRYRIPALRSTGSCTRRESRSSTRSSHIEARPARRATANTCGAFDTSPRPRFAPIPLIWRSPRPGATVPWRLLPACRMTDDNSSGRRNLAQRCAGLHHFLTDATAGGQSVCLVRTIALLRRTIRRRRA